MTGTTFKLVFWILFQWHIRISVNKVGVNHPCEHSCWMCKISGELDHGKLKDVLFYPYVWEYSRILNTYKIIEYTRILNHYKIMNLAKGTDLLLAFCDLFLNQFSFPCLENSWKNCVEIHVDTSINVSEWFVIERLRNIFLANNGHFLSQFFSPWRVVF